MVCRNSRYPLNTGEDNEGFLLEVQVLELAVLVDMVTQSLAAAELSDVHFDSEACCRLQNTGNAKQFLQDEAWGGWVGWLVVSFRTWHLSHSLFLLLQAEDGLLNPFFCVSYGLV